MSSNEKIVFVSGHFNILHPGHLRLFRFAKECGSKLLVGVESDSIAGDAAYVNEIYRLENLKSINWIDDCFIVNEPIQNVIDSLRPDIVVKGKEHEMKFNPEQISLEKYGGVLMFSSGESTFSSIELLRQEFFQRNNNSIKLPFDFIKRHNIINQNLINIIKKFETLKVCVIGDLIVDEYITCQPLGMSQEDPTIVVSPIDKHKFIGGAGIVAAHAAGLGANVNFITICGEDESFQFARKTLIESGVSPHFFIDTNRPTTLKQRYRSKGKTLLRVSYLRQNEISLNLQDQIIKHLETIIHDIDLLVFSDFNYGCLPQTLVDKITTICLKKSIILAADSQSSSQVGDIGRFINMDLITPTEREARLSVRDEKNGLVVLVEQLRKKSNAKNILLKLGEEGLLVHLDKKDKSSDFLTDQIPALNSLPKDVSGAGDSLLITSAMSLACGGSIWDSAFLGSISAAIQVSRVGNIPLNSNELTKEIYK